MLTVKPDFRIKLIFSPSGLSKARRCLHAWGRCYLLGLTRPELTWPEACALPVPKAKIKSRPTDEEKAAKKLYNSLYRPALGKEVHARAQAYYEGQDIDWNDKPGQILLGGMHCLPHPDECETVEAEGEIVIDYTTASGQLVKFKGYRDLLVRPAKEIALDDGTFVLLPGEWLLVDYKTTFTFDFFDREKTLRTVKTPAQLIADPQSNLYAYDVMRRKCLKQLRCRWLYLRTEDKPAAEPVDFVLTFEGASAIVAELAELALELSEHVGAALAATDPIDVKALVDSLPKDPEACAGFGGCEYHHEHNHGGDCVPPEISPGQKLLTLRKKQKARAALPPKPAREKRTPTMGFRNKPTETAAAKQPAAETEPETTEEAVEEVAAEEVAEDLGTEAAAEEAPAPAPAPRAKAAPKAAKAASTAGVIACVEGFSFDVPAGSVLGKSLAKAAKALQAAAAAFEGES